MRRHPAKLTLLETLRGEGLLIGNGADIPVAYEVSMFLQADQRWGDGSLTGPLGRLVGDEPPEGLKLRLADGREMSLVLGEVDDEGATIESATE